MFPNMSDIIIVTDTLAIHDFISRLTELRRLFSVQINLTCSCSTYTQMNSYHSLDEMSNLKVKSELDIEEVKTTCTYSVQLASQMSSILLCKWMYLTAGNSRAALVDFHNLSCTNIPVQCHTKGECFGALQNAIKDDICLRGVIDDVSSLKMTKTGASAKTMKFGCQFENQTYESICVYNETSHDHSFDVSCTPV